MSAALRVDRHRVQTPRPGRFARIVATLTAMLALAAAPQQQARAAVAAPMTVPAGASATVTITITIGTSLGTSSDSDTKAVAITGSGHAAFMPDAPAFTATQLNSLALNFANTTFTFQLFCIGPFCQTLNVTVNNLQFELVQATCAAIAQPFGNVSFSNAVFHATGDYSTSGLASSSGKIDGTNPATFDVHVSNPAPGTVRFDQLAIEDQTFVVPPEQLPSGVNSLTFMVHATLNNATLSGPYASSKDDFDGDDDGTFDACDACTDTDGDGFGNAGFPDNTCAPDNCPSIANASQSDHDADGVGDACDCIADCAPAGGGNGTVDVSDLIAVILDWGACPSPPALCLPDIAPASANGVGNGVVDVSDLIAVILAWGPCP